ncbi:MAG: MFS transporter [Minwuia sp.]|nr:MFS transporter [Minwuia sp.]
MADGGREKRGGIFYGWVIVWAAFTILFVSFGAAYSFTAFFAPLQEEFGATRGDTSLVFGIAGFLYFFLGAFSGPAGDRLGPKPVVVFGAVVAALGLYFAATATRIEQVYWGYGLGVGVGVGCMYVPAVGAVQRWFARRRATASGLAITGIGVGTFVAPFASHELISLLDWRQTYIVLAIIVLVLGIVSGLLLENSPAARGLYPDGSAEPPNSADSAPSMDVHAARRTLPIWLVYVGTLLVSIGLFMPFVHLKPFAKDLGMSATTGVWIVSSIGIGSILGRMLLGPIAERYGRKPVVLALYIGLAGIFLFWYVSTSLWMLLVFGVVFGTLYGGFVALAPALLADYYGVGHAGSILGFVYSSVAVGALIGNPIAGYLYDAAQSYDVPILIGAVLCLAGAVCILVMPSPEKWRAKRFGTT